MAPVTRHVRRRGGSDEGAELIELAVVLPILLLVLAAIMDFGFLFQRYEVVTNAAREGARLGALPGYSTTDVQTRVQNYLTASGLDTAKEINVVPSVEAVGASNITVVTVEVLYDHPFSFIAPFAAMFSGASGTPTVLRATSTMRVERPATGSD